MSRLGASVGKPQPGSTLRRGALVWAALVCSAVWLLCLHAGAVRESTAGSLPISQIRPELSFPVERSYRVVGNLKADLDSDGIKETVLALDPLDGPESERRPPKVVVLKAKGDRLVPIWSAKATNCIDGIHFPTTVSTGEKEYGDPRKHSHRFLVQDINADGKPEIVFNFASWGASNAQIEFNVVGYRNGKYVSLLQRPIVHPLEAGVVIQDMAARWEGKEIVFYSPVYTKLPEDKFRSSHRYHVTIFRWDGKLYRIGRRLSTPKSYAREQDLLSHVARVMAAASAPVTRGKPTRPP
jgi:hypothetical protein